MTGRRLVALLAGVAALAFVAGWALVQTASRVAQPDSAAPAASMAPPSASPIPVADAGPPTGEASPPGPETSPQATTPPEPIPSPPSAVPTTQPSPSASATPALEYVFPVQPAEAASYGPTHHDYPATDIFARCGTPVVAPTTGTVDEVSRVDTWSAADDDPATRGGLSVSLIGVDGVRYYGSHFQSLDDAMQPGATVTAGQPLGTVGRTGNAAATPCHLHFGISPPTPPGDWRTRRGVVPPAPYLDAWRAGEARSPAEEVAALAGS